MMRIRGFFELVQNGYIICMCIYIYTVYIYTVYIQYIYSIYIYCIYTVYIYPHIYIYIHIEFNILWINLNDIPATSLEMMRFGLGELFRTFQAGELLYKLPIYLF